MAELESRRTVLVDNCLKPFSVIELQPDRLVWKEIEFRDLGQWEAAGPVRGSGGSHPFGIVWRVRRVRIALFLDIDGRLRLWCGDRILDAEDPALEVRRWDLGIAARFRVRVADELVLDRWYDRGRVDIWAESVDTCEIVARALRTDESRERFKAYHQLMLSGLSPGEARRRLEARPPIPEPIPRRQ